MFGISIFSANRDQISEALREKGAKQRPALNPLTDSFEAGAHYPGAKLYIRYAIDGTLEAITYKFDSGCQFTEVMKFDALKSILINKYGRPVVTPVESQHCDFEEELVWMKGNVKIQLVNYKWHAAWRLHVSHRLSYAIIQHVNPTFSLNATEPERSKP